MNIVLIGYRGTGKSTVAECLASARGWPRASLDEEIVKRSGMSIPEIVERMGWDHFRDLESGVVKDFAAKEGWILDTGGGVILREENALVRRVAVPEARPAPAFARYIQLLHL